MDVKHKELLKGRVAIVTGGGRGIGRSECLALAACGASVVVSDLGKDANGASTAQGVVREIGEAGGEAVAVIEDLMTTEGVRSTVHAAQARFGGLDILVNNAGLRGGGPIEKLTDDDWDRVIGSHLKASFMMIRESLPLMKDRGGGTIINTGSEAGLGMIFNAIYAAAKEGLAGLTRTVAREQGRFNIRCNLVRPRATADSGGADWFNNNMQGKWRPLVEALGPYWMGDRGLEGFEAQVTPASTAALIAWLCTPAAAHLNGQDFFIAGSRFAVVSPPQFTENFLREGDWTLDAFDALESTSLGRRRNEFKIDNPLVED